MITDAIISIVTAILSGILSLLPVWVPPDMLTETWPGDIASVAHWLNGYFPIYTLGICLGIILALRALLAVWVIAVWVYDRFPFKFT